MPNTSTDARIQWWCIIRSLVEGPKEYRTTVLICQDGSDNARTRRSRGGEKILLAATQAAVPDPRKALMRPTCPLQA